MVDVKTSPSFVQRSFVGNDVKIMVDKAYNAVPLNASSKQNRRVQPVLLELLAPEDIVGYQENQEPF
ncbi:hypothetical protein O9993_12095 [Vibrio lentus]|nr:hypothetical protein [Vibrio lentus]